MKHFTKFSRAIIAIVMMLGVSLTTLAHDFYVGGVYYNILNETAKTVEVTYRGSSYSTYDGEYTGDVAIPNSVTYSGITYSVTSIGAYAFYWCSGLTEVTIGNSVTSIGENAFRYCDGLTSVTIPNSVTSIGTRAFYDCSGLTEVTIPNSVTSIGTSAFCDCSGLTEVIIPNSVTSIGDNAFYRCTGLTEVIIPNSVTSIGEWAFYNCFGLTTVNFNATNCTSMGSSSYPVFANCSNFSTLNIGENVTNIPDYAFYKCSGLTSVTIPNSVTSIGTRAFYGCSGLTEVTIGNSVTSIGVSAFSNCSGLTSVTIPNSVTSIGEDAFYGCTGLTEVNITDLSAWCKIDFIHKAYSNPLYYAKHLKLNGTEITNLVNPNDITEIKSFAFWSCTDLTSVTIPNSVTSIGDEVFKYCSGLNKIISLNPTPPTCASDTTFYSTNYTEATLYVPKDSYAKYFIDGVWGKFTNIVKIETVVSSIKLNATSIQLDKGTIYTLSATINPTDATITDIIWTSSNPQVATVDQSGMVTALSEGIAIITATTIDGSDVSASCNVAVNNVETKISLSKTEASLPVNEIMTLSYTIVPSTTSVQWSTSDPNIAAIKVNSDNSVTVVGMADGIATITATATDGSDVSASCVVTVGNAGITDVKSDNTATEVARYDINGRMLAQPTKGINIIKMSDGSIRKEWVKE